MAIQKPLGPSLDGEVSPPDYFLQTKLGGAASKMLSPGAFNKAKAALDDLIPPLTHELDRLLNQLERAVRGPDPWSRDLIWNTAHEIRGLAGTAGRTCLGAAADLICRYLNGTDRSFQSDAKVLSTITTVAIQAVKKGADRDPMIAILLSNSAQAVAVQRHREGRGDAI